MKAYTFLKLTLQHRADVSPYTSSYEFAETYVFGKQSPGPLHCDHLSVAPLLPKLRGNFAEFLRESYLAPLGILYHPTCVGFEYGFDSFKIRLAFLGTVIHHAGSVEPSQSIKGMASINASLI